MGFTSGPIRHHLSAILSSGQHKAVTEVLIIPYVIYGRLIAQLEHFLAG